MLVAGWTWPPVHVAHVRRLYVDQWVAVMRWPPVAGRRSSGGRSPELRRSPAVRLLLHDPHFLPRFHVRFRVRFHVRWMSLDLKIVAVVGSIVSHLLDHSNRPSELRRRPAVVRWFWHDPHFLPVLACVFTCVGCPSV